MRLEIGFGFCGFADANNDGSNDDDDDVDDDGDDDEHIWYWLGKSDVGTSIC